MPNPYPQKETPSDHQIHSVIQKRWSPLAFSSDPIEEEKINSLFEAARWAPSCFNEQPWRILYATQDNSEEFDKLASLLMEGNDWAKNAYMLILACAKKTFDRKEKPNPHHKYDTGAAIENLFLQASSMDLIAHEMAGFDAEKASEIYNIPENISVIAMMAVGYPGNKEDLSEDLLERENSPRQRKELKEFVFKGEWK